MDAQLNKMNPFLSYNSPPSSPISMGIFSDHQNFQDQPMPNIFQNMSYHTHWDPIENLQWPSFDLKFQSQADQYQNMTKITSSNCQTATYYETESDSWKGFSKLDGNPQVTKIIKKLPKHGVQKGNKGSPQKEQPDQECPQNKNRNMAGVLFQGMLKECQEDESFLNENEGKLNGFSKNEFLKPPIDYKKNEKTFSLIAKFAVKALDKGLVYLVLMIEFLNNEHRFSRWIEQSQVKEQKENLYKEEYRELMRRKFEVVKEEVQKCLEHCKAKNVQDPINVWIQFYDRLLTQKIKDQNKIFKAFLNL